MMKQLGDCFFVAILCLLTTATAVLATYNGIELGFIDTVMVNDQVMENFDDHQIVFYPEDLRDGMIEISGLLESEQSAIPVSKLQVQVTLDGGRNWQPAKGHGRWFFRFHPQLEKTYRISLRVVQETFKTPKFIPLVPIPMELRPVLSSLKPNRWLPGRTYAVNVTGLLLDKVEAISFGNGIQIEDLRHEGDKLLRFSVTIDAKMAPTVRFATVEQQGQNEKTAARGWILKPPLKLGKLPSLDWGAENKLELRQGVIFLKNPEWSFSGDMANNHHPVPVLNDATILTWKEETPGLADLFEIRFFTAAGKLVDKKTINLHKPILYTTSFQPGSQFIARLFHRISTVKRQPVTINGQAATTTPPAVSSFSLQPPIFSATLQPSGTTENVKILSPVETYIRDNKGDRSKFRRQNRLKLNYQKDGRSTFLTSHPPEWSATPITSLT